MLKTKTWILIFAVLLLVCAAVTVVLWHNAPEGQVVEVVQDGTVLETIDLSQVTSPYRFVVEDPNGGRNTVLVEPGRICIEEADCPDQVCVHRGWLTDSAAPIVCLPHRLVIQVRGETDLDSVSQ